VIYPESGLTSVNKLSLKHLKENTLIVDFPKSYYTNGKHYI